MLIFQQFFNKMGDIHKAIKCYQKLNQIQSNLGNAYSNLGGLYVVLGDTQKGNKLISKCIEI